MKGTDDGHKVLFSDPYADFDLGVRNPDDFGGNRGECGHKRQLHPKGHRTSEKERDH